MVRSDRILLSAMVIAVAMAMSVMTVAPAAADPKLPENYNFFAGIPHELTDPNGSLPGANDFTCKPAAAHPDPVVLVHGTAGGGQTNWGAYVPMLKNAGFCVFSLTYGAIPGAPWPINQLGGAQPMENSAVQLKAFIDKILASTGTRKVDIVGHSQGTMMPDYYAKFLGGSDKIGKYVSIAPLWRGSGGGTSAAISAFATRLGIPDTSVPVFASAGEMMTGSAFIAKLWTGGTPYVRGIEYTNISTRYDEAVMPYTSGQVPGTPGTDVRNIVVQDTCAQDYSDHMAIAGSRRTAYMVHNALDPAHPWTVPCEFVPPFTG